MVFVEEQRRARARWIRPAQDARRKRALSSASHRQQRNGLPIGNAERRKQPVNEPVGLGEPMVSIRGTLIPKVAGQLPRLFQQAPPVHSPVAWLPNQPFHRLEPWRQQQVPFSSRQQEITG